MKVYLIWSNLTSNLLAVFATKALAIAGIDYWVETRNFQRANYYITEEIVLDVVLTSTKNK